MKDPWVTMLFSSYHDQEDMFVYDLHEEYLAIISSVINRIKISMTPQRASGRSVNKMLTLYFINELFLTG